MPNNPTHTKSWKTLERLSATAPDIRDLFAQDKDRALGFSLEQSGLFVDLSKNDISNDILCALIDLAREQDVEGARDRMFSGDTMNDTENRAVLHTALRRPASDDVIVNGENVMPFVHKTLGRMKDFCTRVHSGAWTGYTGKRIDTVVNIGIGGSDLGPYMVCEALKSYAVQDMSVHFVSNIDGTHLAQALEQCNPETTLFLVASKTFTTQETMANAHSARQWLLSAAKHNSAVAKHFVALSTNAQAVTDFGIAADNMFPFREWVGGRYSLWSAIGLSIALAIGFDRFEELLAGAYAMDTHFCTAPLEKNLPVLLALTGIWHRNFMNRAALAVLPYDQNLHRFTAFLQQLDMESNGKSVDHTGAHVNYATGPLVFGEPGTNGQHAFYQWIHQGPDVVPCDFIAAKTSNYPLGNHHKLLLTNMLAQSRALMQGRTLNETQNNPHRVFSGNRPSTVILLDSLDPYHLGALIALYEHKVFVQGVIWNINSFDQFGVELGKEMAGEIERGEIQESDPSTLHLKERLGL